MLLSLSGVSHLFRTKYSSEYVLKDITLNVEKGDSVILSGRSGSGKTTLLNILGCLLRPTNGAVFIEGRNATGLSDAELSAIRRDYIGFVFQDFSLISTLSVYENIEYAFNWKLVDKYKRKEKILDVCSVIGLSEHVHKRANQLSGGQQQRVAIARAIVKDPKVILADEPTANLDTVNRNQIISLFNQIHEKYGTAIVLSTHDDYVRNHINASKHIHMSDGVIESMEAHNVF